jgi:hypothetical protein
MVHQSSLPSAQAATKPERLPPPRNAVQLSRTGQSGSRPGAGGHKATRYIFAIRRAMAGGLEPARSNAFDAA